MSDSAENSEYYLQLLSMYIDLGTETVLRLFYHCKPKEDISKFLSLPDSRKILQNLKQRKVLNGRQYNLVTAYCPDADKFDIVLLITLLTSLFPPFVVQPPQRGWNGKVEDSDLSVGADLLRLRKLRNNVLFHRPKAQLYMFQFEHYWLHLSKILKRIIQQIEPKDEEIFNEKIEKYRSRKLDSNQGSKYDNTLRAWEEEIDELQTQVEELRRKLKEFDTFFKRKPERFKRYIKLMIDGGRLVLKSVLYNELNQRQQDIGLFLKENENSLKSKITNTSFIDNIYQNVSSDVEFGSQDDWDVSLLAEIILYGFDDLKPEDKDDIKAIHHAVTCYAETALLSLDSDRFTGVLIELTSRLTSVAKGSDTKKQLKDLIAECSKSDENIVLPEDYLDSLQSKGSHVKNLVDVHKETISKLKEYLNQMEIDGINLKNEHKLEIKIMTTSHNQNTAEEAEETVFTVLHESIHKAVDTSGLPVVRHEIDKIIQSLTSHTDVTKVDVKKHCIILEITCSSASSILHAIRDFESDEFQDLSYNLSTVMTNDLQDTVAIQINFTLESLYEVFERRDEVPEDREIVMQIPYSTPAELKSILSPFESRELTNSVNRISGQLSSHFNETVTIAVTHGMKGISDSDISDSSPTSEDFENDEKCLNETNNQYSRTRNEMIVDTKKELLEDPLESNIVESPSTSSVRSKDKNSADVTDIDLQQSLDRWRAEWNTNKEDLKGKNTGLPIFKEPVCLIKTADGKLQVEPEPMKQIKEIDAQLVVVAIAGLTRTGKSYLMNRLAGSSDGFPLGKTIKSQTKGIWVWCRKHPSEKNTVLLLLDTEGLGDVEKGDSGHDNRIFTLATLLSNVLLYNMMSALSQDVVEKLTFITEMSKSIHFSNFKDDVNEEELGLILPTFVLCLRDFTLELEKDGKEITPDEYLDDCLQLKCGKEESVAKFNRPRECIRKYFPTRKCFVFDSPGGRETIRNMETIPFENLPKSFVEETTLFLNYVYSCGPKVLVSSKPLNGRMFVTLVDSYLKAIRNGAVPDVDDAIMAVAKIENEKMANQAVEIFQEKIEEIQLPILLTNNFEKLNRDIQKAALAQFRIGSMFNAETFEKQAMFKMDELWTKKKKENLELVRQHCESLIQELYIKHVDKKIRKGKYRVAGGYPLYKLDMDAVKSNYNVNVQGIDAFEVQQVLMDFLNKEAENETSIMVNDQKMTEKDRQRELERIQTDHEEAQVTQRKLFERKLDEEKEKMQEHQRKMEVERQEYMKKQEMKLADIQSQWDKQRKISEMEIKMMQGENESQGKIFQEKIQQMADDHRKKEENNKRKHQEMLENEIGKADEKIAGIKAMLEVEAKSKGEMEKRLTEKIEKGEEKWKKMKTENESLKERIRSGRGEKSGLFGEFAKAVASPIALLDRLF